jgi:PAS domain S-box-containing protein
VEQGHEPSPIEGQFLRAVADVLAGIIERRRVEESLRISEERFDLAVRGIDAGVWDWDLRTNMVFYSSHWKGMLGYGEDEISDQFSEWEKRLHPEERDRALAVLRDYLEGRASDYELEHRLRHKDGSYRWCLARGAMTTDPAGRPSRMVGSNLDITERKRVEQELRQRVASLAAAKKILEHLLPSAPLHLPDFVIHGACFAADYAPGDFFDYFALEDGCVVAAIADVSGHGIDAALLMASIQARLRSFAELLPGTGEILKRINEEVLRQTDGERFVTLIMLRIDPRSRALFYSNAGHPSGYLFSRTGEIKSSLDSSSTPLGIVADEEFPIGGPLALEPGDLILLFTDGIFEARSPEGIPFGLERILQVVRDRIDLPNEAILENLRAAVCDFTGSDVLSDDVTILLVRVT